jgi:hypothetical protein
VLLPSACDGAKCAVVSSPVIVAQSLRRKWGVLTFGYGRVEAGLQEFEFLNVFAVSRRVGRAFPLFGSIAPTSESILFLSVRHPALRSYA